MIGKPVSRDHDLLPDGDGPQLGLWHREVDIDGIEGLQCGDFVTGVEVLTGVDGGNPDAPGKRCADGFFRHQRPLLFGGGELGLQIRSIGVNQGLRHGVHRQLRLVTLEYDNRQVGGGFQRVEQGDIRVSIQLHQQGLVRHFLPGFETDTAHNAAHFRGHINPSDGLDRAYGSNAGLPVIERYLQGRDHGSGQGRLRLGDQR